MVSRSSNRVRVLTLTGILLIGGATSSTGAHAATSDAVGVVAHGRLVIDGAATAGMVKLKVWPNQETRRRVKDGEALPVLDLPPVSTNEDGDFALQLPERLSSQYIEPDGSVQIEVIGSDGTTATTQAMSVAPVSTQTSLPLSRQAPSTRDVIWTSKQTADQPSTNEMWWQFSSTRGGLLCGSNSKPWTQAPYVSATA